jgi:hypothetical protein
MKPQFLLFSMMLLFFSCEKEALKSTSYNGTSPIEIKTEIPFKKVAMGSYLQPCFNDTIIKDSLSFQNILSKIDTNLRNYHLENKIFEKDVDFNIYDVIVASRGSANIAIYFEIIKIEEANNQIFVTTKLEMSDATLATAPFYLVKILKTNKKVNFIHTFEE